MFKHQQWCYISVAAAVFSVRSSKSAQRRRGWRTELSWSEVCAEEALWLSFCFQFDFSASCFRLRVKNTEVRCCFIASLMCFIISSVLIVTQWVWLNWDTLTHEWNSEYGLVKGYKMFTSVSFICTHTCLTQQIITVCTAAHQLQVGPAGGRSSPHSLTGTSRKPYFNLLCVADILIRTVFNPRFSHTEQKNNQTLQHPHRLQSVWAAADSDLWPPTTFTHFCTLHHIKLHNMTGDVSSRRFNPPSYANKAETLK